MKDKDQNTTVHTDDPRVPELKGELDETKKSYASVASENDQLRKRVEELEKEKADIEIKNYSERVEGLVKKYTGSEDRPGKVLPKHADAIRSLLSVSHEYANVDRVAIMDEFLGSLDDINLNSKTNYSDERQRKAKAVEELSSDEQFDTAVAEYIAEQAKLGKKVSYTDAFDFVANGGHD